MAVTSDSSLFFLNACNVIFLRIHSLNGAKPSFLFILRYPGSRHVFLCLAKDRHLRRWFSGTSEGGSQLRYNYYPMISDLSKIKPGQIRCGEHTDYGGITLLIQDDVGGLEVRTAD